MSSLSRFFVGPSSGPWSISFIRLAVGLIFFTRGILKFTDPNMGVLRLPRMGFPDPEFTAHFVGTFEMVCGFPVVAGLSTRLVAFPLLVVILSAVVATNFPNSGGQGSDSGSWRATRARTSPCCAR